MRRLVPLAMALAVAASLTLAVPTSAVPDGPDTASAAKQTPTRFALRAAGYGTRIQGGQLPAASGTTAYQVIGCTNKAGIVHKNYEASLTLPSAGTLEGVKTKVWTKLRPKKHEVSAYSRQNIAKVVLGGASGLKLTALTSLSRAWHDKTGFHTKTTTTIGGLAVGGTPGTLPTPGTPIEIPGLATITIGSSQETKGNNFAKARADAVNVLMTATGTHVRIAHSSAQIGDGIISGIFRGSSNGSRVSALTDLLRSGPTPLSLMGCQGTKGQIQGKDVAGLDLGGQIVTGALSSRQMGKQTTKKATGFEQGTVAGINLGAGQLIITAIRGQANVTRFKNGKVISNSKGTGVLTFTANGQENPAPLDGFEIPGLLRVETNIVKKVSNGIRVTAVRITLLDGSGAVINLGQAQLYIRRSGL